MKNLKKLTALFLAFSLAFAFITSSAWAGSPSTDRVPQIYDGIYEYDPDSNMIGTIISEGFDPSGGSRQAENFKLIADQGKVTISFDVNGTYTEFQSEQVGSSGDPYYFFNKSTYTKGSFNYKEENGKSYIYNGVFYLADGRWIEIHRLTKTGSIPVQPTEPQEIETSFMQKVTTASGQYEMYLSGFLTATVTDGDTVLSPSDIAKQSIGIHVKNTKTGETRLMTQSTIEELTFHVAGGTVTSVTVKGRVQTARGTLERYMVDIHL